MKSKSIILIGMAGVGKTTTGKLLAQQLGLAFTDLDDIIIEKEGKALQEIIDNEGEEVFLKLEKKYMTEIDLNNRIVAPGGSIIYQTELIGSLKKQATLIYLKDTINNIQKREKERSTRGVIGLKERTFEELFNERVTLYSKYSDITINLQGKSVEKVVKEIIELI